MIDSFVSLTNHGFNVLQISPKIRQLGVAKTMSRTSLWPKSTAWAHSTKRARGGGSWAACHTRGTAWRADHGPRRGGPSTRRRRSPAQGGARTTCVCVCVCLSVCLFVCLSVCLSTFAKKPRFKLGCLSRSRIHSQTGSEVQSLSQPRDVGELGLEGCVKTLVPSLPGQDRNSCLLDDVWAFVLDRGGTLRVLAVRFLGRRSHANCAILHYKHVGEGRVNLMDDAWALVDSGGCRKGAACGSAKARTLPPTP